jgi:outer membrane protein TolC
MRRLIVLIACGFAVSAAAQPEPERASLSLSAAVERALEVYPTVQASAANSEEARAALGETAAARLPSLLLNGAATRYEKPMVVTPIHGFAADQIPEFDDTLYQGEVSLHYTLFDGGARSGRIRRARHQLESAGVELEATRQTLVARVVATYLEALSRRQILEAHDHRLTALRSELSRVQKQHETGRAAQVEVLRVRAALANAEAERVRSAEALERAERDLARFIGGPEDRVQAGRLVPVVLISPSLASRDTLKSEALEFNPAVNQARQRLASAEANLTVARSTGWPELDLVGSYLYFGSGSESAFNDGSTEWQAGARLSYLLFGGGAQRRAIARAEAGVRYAGEQQELAEIQVAQDVDRALSSVIEAQARVGSLKTAVTNFAEVARIQRLLVETGAGTETDYLDAEADLLTTRANLVEARHGEIAARVELARVVGQLSPAWLARTIGDHP